MLASTGLLAGAGVGAVDDSAGVVDDSVAGAGAGVKVGSAAGLLLLLVLPPGGAVAIPIRLYKILLYTEYSMGYW